MTYTTMLKSDSLRYTKVSKCHILYISSLCLVSLVYDCVHLKSLVLMSSYSNCFF